MRYEVGGRPTMERFTAYRTDNAAASADTVDDFTAPGDEAARAASEHRDDPTSEHTLLTLAQHGSTRSAVDLAIAAWLHAKEQKSYSAKTRSTYESIMYEFRDLLRALGLDLDAADPRRLRAVLAEGNTGAQDYPRHSGHSPHSPHSPHSQVRDWDSQLEQLSADRMTALTLAAQTYAARPARTQYGSRPVAPTTANLRLATLSSFYNYALRHDLLRGKNPIDSVERRRVQSYAGAHPLAYEDLRERLNAIDVSSVAGLRDYALLLLGLHTGRRLSELAGLRREHLVIRPHRVEITWVRCKGGKVMRDELPRKGAQGLAGEALVAWVLRLYGEDGRPDPLLTRPLADLIPLHGSAGTVGQAPGGTNARDTRAPGEHPLWISLAVRNGTFGRPLSLRAIATICEQRLGTSKVHTLRHTFARSLEDAGAKVSEIQARLGHEDLGTTGRYLAQLHQGENRHLLRLSTLYGLTPRFPDRTTDANAPSAPASAPDDA